MKKHYWFYVAAALVVVIAAVNLGVAAFVATVFLILAGVMSGAALKISPRDRKVENIEKVFELVRTKGEVTNNDIEREFGVSDATAERYLEDLEQEGRIIQLGNRGKSVVYKEVAK